MCAFVVLGLVFA